MTYSDLLHYTTTAVAGSSLLLAVYRQFGEKLLLIWIPKSENRYVYTFWATVDKFIQTLELVAMNSQSLKAKNAQDFVLAAKISLPDATVDKIVEKAKEEALKK